MLRSLEVARLIRIRFGELTLPSQLRQGRWQELTAEEIKPLTEQVDLKGKKYTGLYGRARLRHQRGTRPPRKPRRNPYRR